MVQCRALVLSGIAVITYHCVLASASLFSFGNSKPTNQNVPLSEYVHGSEEGNPIYHKSQTQFICQDTSNVVLPFTSVNDNYCDCADGSDEPGTSACIHGTFTCRNLLHKSHKIPSSRVGDSICDCCDGSDETSNPHMLCSNTCAQVAKQEFAKLEKFYYEYQQGNVIREKYVDAVDANLNEKTKQLEQFRMHGKDLKTRLNDAQVVYDEEIHSEKEMNIQLVQNTTEYVYNILRLHGMSRKELVLFTKAFMDVIDVKLSEVKRLYSSMNNAQPLVRDDDSQGLSVSDDNSDILKDDDEDGYHEDHHDDVEEDFYASKHEHIETHPASTLSDEEEDTLRNAANAIEVSAIEDVLSTSCAAANDVLDPRMQAYLCLLDTDDIDNELRFTIVYFIRFMRLAHQAEVILGYYLLNNTFEDAYSFVTAKFIPETPDVCLADFSEINSVCSISSLIQDALSEIEHHVESDSTKAAKLTVDAVQIEYTNNVNSRKEVKKALKYHDKLASLGHGEMLFLADKCFEVEDGKFRYSVCPLGEVTQSNIGSDDKTRLGSFSSIVDEEDGSIVLVYDKGAHCHAFGAREARVIVTCGRENAVTQAREPSTCKYELHMKSPVGCTNAYATAKGLPISPTD